MCGIIAIHHKMHLPIDAKLLKKMGDTLHHRGPDDEGIFIENQIGFFHKRLSIIDLSGGHQPMTDNDCTIAFNGEIYNYVELRQGLVQKGYHFKTHSDTEVILKMYQEYGKDAIALLNGMFAFCFTTQKNNYSLPPGIILASNRFITITTKEKIYSHRKSKPFWPILMCRQSSTRNL